jgi:hypothetical protein
LEEVLVASKRYDPGICLKKLRKALKIGQYSGVWNK